MLTVTAVYDWMPGTTSQPVPRGDIPCWTVPQPIKSHWGLPRPWNGIMATCCTLLTALLYVWKKLLTLSTDQALQFAILSRQCFLSYDCRLWPLAPFFATFMQVRALASLAIPRLTSSSGFVTQIWLCLKNEHPIVNIDFNPGVLNFSLGHFLVHLIRASP